MSQWSHIQGCLLLSSEPFEFRKIKLEPPAPMRNDEEHPELVDAWEKWRDAYVKSAYLPFPEEQFKIGRPLIRRHEKKDPSLYINNVSIYSLPRARKYIEEAFSLMPQGEVGFTYAIKQDWTNCRESSSWFEFPCLKKYFKEAVTKLYQVDKSYYSYTYDELRKYYKLEDTPWVDKVNEIVVGIVEDLRYCSYKDLEDGLEAFIKHLEKNKVNIIGGVLEFIDDWENFEQKRKHIFRAQEYEGFVFETIDMNTNTIIHKKIYSYPLDKDGLIDYEEFEKTGWIITTEGER